MFIMMVFLSHDQVITINRKYAYSKKDLLTGAFILNRFLGKLNFKMLNRFVILYACSRGIKEIECYS